MIIQIILVLVAVCVLAMIINGIEDYTKVNKLSFRETLDLTGLPIITLYQGNKKFNFLLDTGATASNIHSEVLTNLKNKELDTEGYTTGIGGQTDIMNYVEVELEYDGHTYVAEFLPVDLSVPFGEIKTSTGAVLHGILGSEFFTKYKYILDFNKLTAYHKK